MQEAGSNTRTATPAKWRDRPESRAQLSPMLNLADIEMSVTLWLVPPIALILAAAIFAYVRRLTDNIAAVTAFKSRGFRLFDTILFNDKEAVIAGQNIWSTYILFYECPRHPIEVVPNDRLKFQRIAKVPMRLESPKA